jgi:hypothetical protein
MPYKSPAARKAYAKAYHLKHHDKHLEAARRQRQTERWKTLQPDRAWKNSIQRYGVTPERYAEMLMQQEGKCAICKRDNPNNGYTNKHFDVDHCHRTGKVRGLLCRQCNAMLGQIEKVIHRSELAAAVREYLDLTPEWQPKAPY